MQNKTKFAETQLPPIEYFNNALNDEPLSNEDYERAQEIWKFSGIQNMPSNAVNCIFPRPTPGLDV